MLTYDFEGSDGPIYLNLYKFIKADILEGKLVPGEKLPSKRAFANNNGISVITIQNAYEQLLSEGYIYALPKKGYYVANIEGMGRKNEKEDVSYGIKLPQAPSYKFDFSNNGINSENFPFTIWNKLSRAVMADKKDELMEISPASGVRDLRQAIADHLKSFRGMLVDPDQIVIGAGTEYLYTIITRLLGSKNYVIESPGYKKLISIYEQNGVNCGLASLDEMGVTVNELQRSKAEVAHICPNHHFPTGITMPASRRYEVLNWANEVRGRYIIEDDYDSEFRTAGRPIPTLFSIDNEEKVIYMNTFSKSLSPTIRISYMILPVHLANKFYESMSFYACTVSNFEQYTLAEFISQGYFEKHINRMRLYYIKQRKGVIEKIEKGSLGKFCSIIENDSGLHLLIKLKTEMLDREITERLEGQGIKLRAISDYYLSQKQEDSHLFIINYSNLDGEKLEDALNAIAEVIK